MNPVPMFDFKLPITRQDRVAFQAWARARQEQLSEITTDWRVCVDLPGYEVSEDGLVRNATTGRAKPQSLSNSRYAFVTCRFGKGTTRGVFVHRLVAAAYCSGRSADRNVVNHRDGNRLNNHWSNLEWCSYSENATHAVRDLGTLVPPVMRGIENRQHRRVIRIDPNSGDEVEFETMTAAAATGFDIRGIYAACCGEQRTHYGFRWKYASGPSTRSHSSNGAPKPLFKRGSGALSPGVRP